MKALWRKITASLPDRSGDYASSTPATGIYQDGSSGLGHWRVLGRGLEQTLLSSKTGDARL